MLKITTLLGLLCSASGLSLGAASRSGPITMGLAVGDSVPKSVLSKAGVGGKKAVLFFYGADDAPSCSKELSAFEGSLEAFKSSGFEVVGVRNEAGDKGYSGSVKVVVDSADAMRNEIGIEKDLFGLLGGRETYVVDAKGVVVGTHRNQFDPDSHVSTALDAVEKLPAPAGFDFKQIAGILGVNLY